MRLQLAVSLTANLFSSLHVPHLSVMFMFALSVMTIMAHFITTVYHSSQIQESVDKSAPWNVDSIATVSASL